MAKILIVDDSSFARNRLRLMFEMEGHEVVGLAANGEQAFELYKSQHPEIVTLDHLMTGESGEDILHALLKYDPDVKAIMVSGSGDHAIEERVLQAGAKAFIQKMSTADTFLKTVDQVMQA